MHGKILRFAQDDGCAIMAPAGRIPLALMMLLVTLVTAAYWIVWYLVPGGQGLLATLPGDPGYIRFENAFLVADAWMALASLLAAIALLRGRPAAVPWLWMAGSAGLYLAGMDILFDVQNGVYSGIHGVSPRLEAAWTEIAVNAGTVGFSLWAIGWAARHRSWSG